MVLPGHLAAGYLATRALLAIFHPGFSSTEIDALLIIGTLAGELPDIDLAKLYFDHKLKRPNRTNDHRVYITHAPLFWLIISITVALVGFLVSSIFVEWIGWLIWAGSWTHLAIDSIEYGVMWAWPFSKKLFALKKEVPVETIDARPGSPKYHFKYIKEVYLKTVSFWAEIIITLAALWLLLTAL